jgi:hypothetical protein
MGMAGVDRFDPSDTTAIIQYCPINQVLGFGTCDEKSGE